MSRQLRAPFCKATGAYGGCRRRTRHESGLCPQHRPGLNGRGQVPLSERPMHTPRWVEYAPDESTDQENRSELK